MAEPPTTRSSLLLRLRDARDREAWRHFVRLYGPVVYGYGRRRGLQDADAADLTQEVLRAVSTALGRLDYDHRRGAFRAWLFTLAHHKLYDLLARQRRPGRGSGDPGVRQRLDEQRPNNLLRWDVQVEPGMSGEKALAIDYEFKMEHDKAMSIASFQTSGIARTEPAAAPLPVLTVEEAAKVKASLAKLSPEDRQLAEAQVYCAIDQESPLGINGPPLKSVIKGQAMFFCCKGCQSHARNHPDEALAMLEKLRVRLKGGTPPK